MAIKFTQIRDPKLQLTDTLSFGKLSGCRICDVIEDNYAYFQWLFKNSQIGFSSEVRATVAEFVRQAAEKQHHAEEVKSWLGNDPWFSDWDDDIPF
jgi:hypothetical protein